MSGGLWDYQNDVLRWKIFADEVYDEETDEWIDVDNPNPLEDTFLSELLHDMFDILHDCDWYLSGDIGKETYNRQKSEFLAKWKEKFTNLDI
jgi:hypothetical protein